MTYGPPPYPRATSSPAIILLASGLTGVLGFLLGFFAGIGTSESATPTEGPPYSAPEMTISMESPSASASGTQAPTAAVPQPSGTATGTGTGAATSVPGTGTLVVGVDIQPGTYQTQGLAPGQAMCYWARLSGTTGDPSQVIAFGSPKAPESVTVAATDKAFQTGGCTEWTRMAS